MSWATPSCISRDRRRRSSAVAASRNAENSRAVSRWTALGPSRRISLRIRSSTPIRAGSTRADSTPATIAVVPASVLSGNAKTWSCSTGQSDRPRLDRDVLALVDVDRGAHRLGHQRGEGVAARHADHERRGGQVVADRAEDRAAERDRVEAVVEAAGDVDQLPDQPLRVVVGRERVRLLVERGVQEGADQAEAEAGHAPAEGAEALVGARGRRRTTNAIDHDRGELGRQGQRHALERAVEAGGERGHGERAEDGERAVDGEAADRADHRGLDGDDHHDREPLPPVGEGGQRPDAADRDQRHERGGVLRPQHGAEQRDQDECPCRGAQPDVLAFANPHVSLTC